MALCEQVEDPKLAKGLVRREVVRLYTPGTLFDHELLPAKESNFLVSLHWDTCDSQGNSGFGLATLDLSTGEFWVSESRPHHNKNDLLDELVRAEPKELIFSKDLPAEIFHFAQAA